MNARTLPTLLARRAQATPSAAAYCIKRRGAWTAVSWRDFERGTQVLAQALAAHGVAHGDRVGLIGPTCIEWDYLQMAALRLGAVAVGIDASYTDETLHALLHMLGLAALGVGSAETLSRVPAEVRASLKLVACLEGPAAADAPSVSVQDVVQAGGDARVGASLENPPADDDLAIMVFTSGTTGSPKPIAYTHGQIALAVEAIVRCFPDIGPGSHFACWLPLANLFQRIINFCAIEIGATSYMVSDPRSLTAELRAIAPAILIGVPRFFERLHAGIESELAVLPGARGRLARWALALAGRRASNAATGTDRQLSRVADALVYSRVRATFGPHLRYLVSGSAPMSPWLLDWYDALGLPVYEAYGVSENIVPVAMNCPGARRSGTVGRPLPVNDVRIDEHGEIWVRGPGVHRDVAESGDAERHQAGYWATGDLGRLDADGYLTVTGRKTDVFKTSTGRWIVPQTVEAALRGIAYVDYLIVLGAGRPAVAAIASLRRDVLHAHATTLRIDALRPQTHELTPEGAALVAQDFGEAAARLPEYQRPQAVILLGHAFGIDTGELTTNLKLRRQAIAARYAQAVEEAYARLEAARSAGTADRTRPLVLFRA